MGQEVRFKQASRSGLCPSEYEPVKWCVKQVFYNRILPETRLIWTLLKRFSGLGWGVGSPLGGHH